MALMAPILPPRHPTCASCRSWVRRVGYSLGECWRGGVTPFTNDEGQIIRANATRGDEQFACHERKEDGRGYT